MQQEKNYTIHFELKWSLLRDRQRIIFAVCKKEQKKKRREEDRAKRIDVEV